MLYHCKQLENGRWGIFIDGRLVATIGCGDTCQTIVDFLQSRLSQPKIPAGTETYQINRYFQEMQLRL